ncbi:MAG: hypothetical protein JW394_0610 [Nitrospira sp.]|nr:hypothetical protein [Nitrospira sp.]
MALIENLALLTGERLGKKQLRRKRHRVQYNLDKERNGGC